MTATLSLSETEILTAVVEIENPVTIQNVMKDTRFGYESVRQTLNDFTDRGYVNRESIHGRYEFSTTKKGRSTLNTGDSDTPIQA